MSDPFPSGLPAPDRIPPTGLAAIDDTPSPSHPSGGAPLDDSAVPLDGDDATPLGDADEPRPMDGLLELIRGEFIPAEKAYAVSTRPGLALLLRTDVTSANMTEFRRRSTIKKAMPGRDAVEDQAKFSALLLATYTVCLLKSGVEVHRCDLEPSAPDERANFGSRELLNALGATSRAEGVRKLFGSDGPLMAMGTQLLTDSGMLDEPDEADLEGPTGGR